MERACDVLAMRMYWLSAGPDDPITDFGFSKSGDETLAEGRVEVRSKNDFLSSRDTRARTRE